MPLHDAWVDLALSTISFHHWHDQAAGCRDITRALRSGGYVVRVDMSFPDWLVRLLRVQWVHRTARLQAIFHQAGVRVQMQQTVAWRGWLATVGMK